MATGASATTRADRSEAHAPWRLLAIHAQPLVLHGLRAVVAGRDDIEVVGSAGSVAAGRELLDARACDIAIIGPELSDGSGLELVAELRLHEEIQTTVLCDVHDEACRPAALEHGADAVLDLSTSGGRLMTLLVETALGTVEPDAALEPVVVVPLPPRQRQIVNLVVQGRSNDEIGAALGISPRTVETHLSRLYERFGLVSRTEIPLLAARSGWLDAPADDPD